jgi:hypothetical protein
MKFVKQAIAAFLVYSSLVEAKTFTRKDFDARVKAGKVDKRKLIRNAIPYKTALRRMEDTQYTEGEEYTNYYDQENSDYAEEIYGDNQMEDYEYAPLNVTADFKLQFNSCLSLESENYNLLLDNLVNYAQSGALKSIRNYVLFDVCQDGDCSTQNSNKDNVYMVDLLTFIEAVIEYGPTNHELVCDACQTYGEDVCGVEENTNDQNRNRRKLQDIPGYAVFDEDMCDKCEALNCWYDADGDQEEDFESIEAWITEIAECKETGSQWQNLDLFAGWMCNSDGSGIEVGVFIDQYCRMYHGGLAFSSLMQDEDYQYFFQSQDIIPYMFTDAIECKDNSELQYVDYDTYEQLVNNNDQDYDGDDQEASVNEACTALFEGDFVPRSLGNCGQPQNLTQQEMYQQAAEYNGGEYQYSDGDEDGNEDNQGQNMYQYVQAQQMLYNSYGQDVSWYTFDLSAQAALDGASTCEAVTAKSQAFEENAYADDENSTNFWNFNKFNNGNSALQTRSASLSPLEIAWVVISAVVATALFMHYTRKQVLKRKSKHQNKELYVKTNDKGQPLIIS